jgi:hypothetical protein
MPIHCIRLADLAELVLDGGGPATHVFLQLILLRGGSHSG